MKLSKIIAGMLAGIMIAMSIAGCAEAQPGGDRDNADARNINITVIVDNIGDNSYNDGIIKELRDTEERYKDISEIALNINIFSMEAGTDNELDELERAFKDDSELVIIANLISLPVLEPAAGYHPEKNFIVIDNEATGSNIFSALFKPSEAAYMCGYLAAKMSRTGIIGIVIGVEIPALFDFCVGYIQGAVAADPGCKVIVSTVGNFYDAGIGYQLAASQFENGADICFSAAGGAGLGCIQAAKDYGCYSIGVDVDQTEYVDEELRDIILTSCLKNFDTLTSVILAQYIEGDLGFGQTGRFGIKDGAVGIARNSIYQRLVPQDIQDEVDEQEELIRGDEIRVRSAFEMTQTEIEGLIASVKP